MHCAVLGDLCLLIRLSVVFFFQAEDGIRDLGRSRGLGDVYKRQAWVRAPARLQPREESPDKAESPEPAPPRPAPKEGLSLIHI